MYAAGIDVYVVIKFLTFPSLNQYVKGVLVETKAKYELMINIY